MRRTIFWTSLFALVATLIAAPSPNVIQTRLADGFDFPVGKPNAEGYYKSRGWLRYHPGEDWNRSSGGNSDLGDPVYNVANGLVVFAKDARRGWGNVVIVRHTYFEGSQLRSVDSFYAHLASITVREGQQILRGQQVGTIGTNRGMYTAHLHFEMRKNLNIGVNRSAFKVDLNNYFMPTKFLDAHRKLPGTGRSALVAVNTFQNSGMQFAPPYDETQGRRLKSPELTKKSSNSRQAAEPKREFRVNRFEDLGSF